MPFCTYCGQSFTRDEHLERHILTHTNVKPHKCYICYMSFARRDLLHRHHVVHGRDSNTDTSMQADMDPCTTAGRTPIACTNCAKTKTKCDKRLPCSRCASRNLKCIARPTRRYAKPYKKAISAQALEQSDDAIHSASRSPLSSSTLSSQGSSGMTSVSAGTPATAKINIVENRISNDQKDIERSQISQPHHSSSIQVGTTLDGVSKHVVQKDHKSSGSQNEFAAPAFTQNEQPNGAEAMPMPFLGQDFQPNALAMQFSSTLPEATVGYTNDARWVSEPISHVQSPSLPVTSSSALNAAQVSAIQDMAVILDMLHGRLINTMRTAWTSERWQRRNARQELSDMIGFLRDSTLLQKSSSSLLPIVDLNGHVLPHGTAANGPHFSLDNHWHHWRNQEKESRIIYSFVLAEQEVALLHDKAPLLSVGELELPMPDADALWDSPSSQEWASSFCTVHQFSNNAFAVTSGARPPSLNLTYQQFLASQHNNITSFDLTPLQLRLLLQPLQTSACTLRADINMLAKQAPLTADITDMYNKAQSHLTSCQLHLERWYSLVLRFLSGTTDHSDPFVCSMLAIYHLIYLTTLLDFPSLERAIQAGRQTQEHPHRAAIIFHCSQALTYLQCVHASLQPPWWPAALYRAALVLWTYGDAGREVVLQQCMDALASRAPLNGHCLVVREKLSVLASGKVLDERQKPKGPQTVGA